MKNLLTKTKRWLVHLKLKRNKIFRNMNSFVQELKRIHLHVQVIA